MEIEKLLPLHKKRRELFREWEDDENEETIDISFETWLIYKLQLASERYKKELEERDKEIERLKNMLNLQA